MRTRLLLYTCLSAVFLLLGWLYFVMQSLGPVSDLTLQLLGDALDIIRPVPHESSTTDKILPNPFYPVSQASDDEANGTVHLPDPGEHDKDKNDIFRNIQVISLPRRIDRRISMERLREALFVNWTYVDATDAQNDTILRLMDCIRLRRTQLMDASLPREFAWPKDFLKEGALYTADILQDISCPSPDETSSLHTGNTGVSEDATRIQDSVPELRPLTCATHNSSNGLPYDPSLPPHMLLTTAKIACWYSHFRVLEKFAYAPLVENNETTSNLALILEDDVNMERDIREQLPRLVQHLPDAWDILFLGESLVRH